MDTLLKSVFALLITITAALPAGAADMVLDGESSCLAIGGIWDALGTCHVSDYTIAPGMTLIVMPGVRLTSDGYFTADGPLHNYGIFEPGGIAVNNAVILNRGTLRNRGWLHPHSAIENEGVFENQGLLDICMGVVRNHAYMHNTDTIENWYVMENAGLLVNDGYIHNPDLGFVGITNYGAIENNDVVDNEGFIVCGCGAAWYGSGPLRGNPIEYEPCDPGEALRRLQASIMDLGPTGKDWLSKDQIIGLVKLLGRAGKRLAMDQPDMALENLESFVQEVGRLVGGDGMAAWVGQMLVARSDRIIESISR